MNQTEKQIRDFVEQKSREMLSVKEAKKPNNKNLKQLRLLESNKKPQKKDLGSSTKKFKLTERIQLKTSTQLYHLFKLSKELYNRANSLIIKGFHMFVLTKLTQKVGKRIRYLALNEELKNTQIYRALPAQTSQQILMVLDKNWKSFFEGLDDWKKNPDKYQKRPNPPDIKGEDDENLLIFTNQQCRIKNNLLYFPSRVNLDPIKVDENRITKLKQIRILPRGHYSILEIVYEKDVLIPKIDKTKKNRILAFDLGVRNTVCCVNNIGLPPFIVKGGAVKWINQYYNKQRSKFQKIYKNQGIKGQTKRLEKLDRKRNNKIDDLFHKLSHAIISYCIFYEIGTIVIGYNEQWKQRSRLGRRNNQNFNKIPFYRLIQKIDYKARLKGIKVVLINESHTSKCSFLDNESIEHHETYLGKRGVYRSKKLGGQNKVDHGLFKTSGGKIINSDVNGAYNILWKAFPKAFADGIEGLGLVPYSVSFSELKQLANLKSTQDALSKASQGGRDRGCGVRPL